MHAELTYFEGAHFAHIVAYEEHKRLARIARQNRDAIRFWPNYRALGFAGREDTEGRN